MYSFNCSSYYCLPPKLQTYRATKGNLLKAISASLPCTGGAYLDFGCNIGLLLDQNRHRFSSVYGVEINDEAAAFAAEKLGINTIFPTLDALPTEATFDLITLIDVIEHVLDPVELIKALALKLTADGALFLRLPVTNGILFSKHSPEQWKFVYAPYHLSMFSVQAIQALARQAGLACEITIDETMFLTPMLIAIRLDNLVPKQISKTTLWKIARYAVAKVVAPIARQVFKNSVTSETVFVTLRKAPAKIR